MSAPHYEPGTVAVATVDGRTQRVFRTDNEWCDESGFGREHREVTDVRPLVVLDLEEPSFVVAALRDTLPERRGDWDPMDRTVALLAELVEAQMKPPRIPEPGLWGVVEASMDAGTTRSTWVHTPEFWYAAKWDSARSWSDLNDPTLIREGVES